MIGRILGIGGNRTTTTTTQDIGVTSEVAVDVGVTVAPTISNVMDFAGVEKAAEVLGGALERAAEAQAGALERASQAQAGAVTKAAEAVAEKNDEMRGLVADYAQIGGFLISCVLFFWAISGSASARKAMV